MAIAAVAALAAVVRLPLLFDRYDVAFAPDSASYLQLANRLLGGLHFPSAYRAPGYPLFIALAHALPGRVPDMTILLQHALGVAIAAAIVAFGWRWLGPAAGIGAGVVWAVSPIVLNVEHDVLPDAAFGAAVLAATIVLAAAVVRDDAPSYRLLILAGVLFGLAAYVKPNAQAFVVAAIVPLAVATRSVRRTVAGSAVLAAALLLTVTPWIVRNGAMYGQYSMTSQGGDALYLRAFDQDKLPIPTDTPEGRIAARIRAQVHAATPDAGIGEPPASYTQVATALTRRGMTYADAVRIEGRLARTAILRHPVEYATGTVRNIVLLWGLSAYPSRAITHLEEKLTADEFPRPVALALWGAGGVVGLVWFACALGGLAIAAVFVAGPRDARVVAATFGWVWLVVIVGVAMFNSPAARFAAQVLPQFLLLGAAGAAVSLRLVRERLAGRTRTLSAREQP
jgi:4-amino-4-deoxy-L-arabinose transferase-like glycosyltransferase